MLPSSWCTSLLTFADDTVQLNQRVSDVAATRFLRSIRASKNGVGPARTSRAAAACWQVLRQTLPSAQRHVKHREAAPALLLTRVRWSNGRSVHEEETANAPDDVHQNIDAIGLSPALRLPNECEQMRRW